MEFLPTWVWISLVVSFSASGWKLTAEYFKVDSHALIFWRGLLMGGDRIMKPKTKL